MRSAIYFALLSMLCAARLVGQDPGPLQFREEYLLESRIADGKPGEEYSPAEIDSSMEGPSISHQMLADRNDEGIYRTARWPELLAQTDTYRRMGGFDLAEKQYLAMLEMLRKAQGPAADDVAVMLDHIGEFYLEARNCQKAYEYFSLAVQVRRRGIEAVPPALAGAPASAAAMARKAGRLHLADLLTRLGQLDLARGELVRAGEELTEAVAISNEPIYLRYASGLYAIYFRSQVLERQSKWQEAEALWRDAVHRREKLLKSDPYWNARKEMAAFYARQGDFHAAAEIARQVVAGVGGKTMQPELGMPYLDSRPRAVENQPQYSPYTKSSDIAMSEIEAIDTWSTEGPAAAAALLKDPAFDSRLASHGADSDRAQLLAWLQRRVFLHMSILLDGEPSQERVNRAYQMFNEIKGKFLESQRSKRRLLEFLGIQSPKYRKMLDQLAAAQQRHARLFLGNAVEGKPVSAADFAAVENRERILSEAISSNVLGEDAYFNLDGLRNALTVDSAFLDFVLWQRTDRQTRTMLPPEYGAFVVKSGQHLTYVRLGPAAPIDADIKTAGEGSRAARQALRRLYETLIAPLVGAAQPRPALPVAAELLIVPDGMLTLAPFGGFLDGEGRYLVTRYRIRYLGSWRDLGGPAAVAPVKSSPPLVVASPDFAMDLGAAAATPAVQRRFKPFLPGRYFGDEAADIAQTLRLSPDRVVTGTMARKEVIRAAEGPKILHFATHSKTNIRWEAPAAAWSLFEFPLPLNMENPFLRSVIALAGANRSQTGDEDGLLTGLEVEGLHLSGTKLVVLSSCESGQGTPVDGQGVLGLRTAFAVAGAGGLVTNLWPVDDEAGRRFMQLFYSHIDVLGGPAEALRLAQLEMMTKTPFKEPFYWAGYQCSCGAQRVLTEPAAQVMPARNVPVAVAPACYELTGHRGLGADKIVDTIRIKLGSAGRRVNSSPTKASYQMESPGSVAEEWSRYSASGQALAGLETLTEEPLNLSVGFLVEKELEQSRITIQIGGNHAIMMIYLKGAPGLIPSLDIPRALPPLGSYTEATMFPGRGNNVENIDSIEPCAAAPPH